MGKNSSSNPKKPSSSWTKALFSLVALAALIGVGIFLSEGDSKMIPYDQYKESRIKKASQTVEDKNNSENTESGKRPLEVTAEDETLSDLNESTEDLQLAQLNTPKPPGSDLPRKTLEHISKGMGLSEQGKYELAELEFEKAAELSPNSSEVYAIWGTSHRMQGKFEGANKRFSRAFELAPDDEEIAFNWGLSRLHEKTSDEAIKLFKQTIELDPKHYMAYNYLGKSYGLQKDYKHESESYKKALEIKEDFAQAHFNLAVTLSLMKKFDEAGPHFTRAIELDKQFDKPFVNQFLVAMGLREAKGKRADLKEVKKSDKKDEEEETSAEHADHKDEKADAKDAHDKKEEGSEGSDTKIVKPITTIKGIVKINGESVSSPGLVILESKSKLKVPKQESKTVKIFQRGLNFSPQNSVVMVGSTVDFINDDKEVHNIFSKSRNNQFNLGAMASGTSKSINLDQPGPIILRCNLHKDMIGTLFVVPNGYYSKLDENGAYEFNKVKSQEYLMQFWHPRLTPDEVNHNMKNAALTGVDHTMDFDIASKSEAGEIHDMVDQTDYNLLVANIAQEMEQAIKDWKAGKKYLSHKRMLKAITYYFAGGGLKGAIAKSFSVKRSDNLEKSLDDIRKIIATRTDEPDEATEAKLKGMSNRAIAQLKNNVQELYARIAPEKAGKPVAAGTGG